MLDMSVSAMFRFSAALSCFVGLICSNHLGGLTQDIFSILKTWTYAGEYNERIELFISLMCLLLTFGNDPLIRAGPLPITSSKALFVTSVDGGIGCSRLDHSEMLWV
jgi:hypothetical protein